jgi:hypothetical protein
VCHLWFEHGPRTKAAQGQIGRSELWRSLADQLAHRPHGRAGRPAGVLARLAKERVEVRERVVPIAARNGPTCSVACHVLLGSAYRISSPASSGVCAGPAGFRRRIRRESGSHSRMHSRIKNRTNRSRNLRANEQTNKRKAGERSRPSSSQMGGNGCFAFGCFRLCRAGLRAQQTVSDSASVAGFHG